MFFLIRSKNQLETFTGNTSDYLWPLIKAKLHVLVKSKGELNLTTNYSKADYQNTTDEKMTHTNQIYPKEDYRRVRFETVTKKLVNEKFAIDLVHQDPVVVSPHRVVWSSGGGPLGHPRIYINLDRPEIHDCGYSGRRFIYKKYYDPAKHGPSIGYDEYLEDMKKREFAI
jgi:NADH dehydrogenase (ubiquinone) Fe-S protein 6